MMEFNTEKFEIMLQEVMKYAPKVIMAIVALVIGYIIVSKLSSIISAAMERRGVDKTLKPFLSSLVDVLLKLLLFITIAGILGVETASFAAIIAAMAFAVGMAMQGSLGNFAGGVLLLFFKPIKVGDLIKAQGYVGVVEEIQAFSTKLVTPDNKTIIIPNGALSSGPIENISTKGIIRVDMTFGIGYGDDIDRAKQVIQQVSDSCKLLLDKPTDIFVSELADSSVNFAVRPWALSDHYWDVYFFFHENIKKAFDREKIGIPYQTIDINLLKN